jgi:hypothetical protein
MTSYWPSCKYHQDCPEGKIFESPEAVPEGWVDSPADIAKVNQLAPVEKVVKKVVKKKSTRRSKK